MNLLKAAIRGLHEIVTATELKGVTDPAIVERLRKAEQLAVLVSKRKLQTFDRVRIAEISSLLRETLDFVPLSVKLYRKQLVALEQEFAQIVDTPEKTSRSSSIGIPKKTPANAVIYDDLLMEHCEIDEMARSVRALSRTVGRQRQDIAIEKERHEEELDTVERMFRQESFKERRKDLQLRRKEQELLEQENGIEEIRNELKRLREENQEEKLISQLQLKELSTSLEKTQVVQNPAYQSTFNVPIQHLSTNEQQIAPDQPQEEYIEFSESDKNHYAERIAEAALLSAPRSDDSRRIRELKLEGLTTEVAALLDELATGFVMPLASENEQLKTQLEQEALKCSEIGEENSNLADQLREESVELEKMRYENQRIREELQNMNKQLETSRIESKYPEHLGTASGIESSGIARW